MKVDELREQAVRGFAELKQLIADTPVAEAGPWAVLGVESGTGWPDHIAAVTFDQRQYFLVPATLTYHEALAFRCEVKPSAGKEDIDEAQRFLSVLSFRWQCSVRVVDIRRAGFFVMAAPIRKFWMPMINNELEIEAIAPPKDKRVELALALLREGENLHSPIANNTYAFLSFYRAIDVAIPRKAEEQIAWIDANWRRACRDSKKRAEAMFMAAGSVGQVVYGHRRSALAHAKRDSILNPDRLSQSHQFILDAPIVRDLARLAVKETFELKGRFD